MGKLLRATQLAAIILFTSAGLFMVACSLPFSGWRALSVQTGSMEPNIHKGSLVLVHSISPSTLKKGDVITYKSNKGGGVTITHRVLTRGTNERGVRATIVKGDANATADMPVSDSQIVGKVETVTPYLGHLLDFIKKPLGLVLFVYIPVILIMISEIKLLVKRLTKLELEKQKAALRTEASGIIQPMHLATATAAPVQRSIPITDDHQSAPSVVTSPPVHAHQPKSSIKSGSRIIGRLSIVLLALFAISAISPTLSQLNYDVTLEGNTISTGPLIPPVHNAHVLIEEVDFPCLKSRHCKPDPVSFSIYSPKRFSKVDLKNWTISSKGGVLYTFKKNLNGHEGDAHERFIDLKKSQKLDVNGDFLVLKNATGAVVDGVSWGSDTTYFTPSIQGIIAGDDIRRTKHLDTDSAKDWFIIP